MDHFPAEDGRIVSERLLRKLNEVYAAAQKELSGSQDHVFSFNLQPAYFRCACECFCGRRRREDINNCVETCTVPVVSAQQLLENEMAMFRERLNRSMMACQDKLEYRKLQALRDLESCTLPHIAKRFKSSNGMNDS